MRYASFVGYLRKGLVRAGEPRGEADGEIVHGWEALDEQRQVPVTKLLLPGVDRLKQAVRQIAGATKQWRMDPGGGKADGLSQYFVSSTTRAHSSKRALWERRE